MGEVEDLAVVILAAGEGTRMRSRRPKVLHPVCGRPVLMHAIHTSRQLGAKRIVLVLGSGEDAIREAVGDEPVEIVRQAEQRGTAHAALQARALLSDHEGPLLVMYGDHPLFRPETLAKLIATRTSEGADLTLLVADLPEPGAYGRVVRGPDGSIERIVEVAQASDAIRALSEVNLGVYVAPAPYLFEVLARVGNDNPKGEYYLTDVVDLALTDGRIVVASTIDDCDEAYGINSRVDLARAERIMRARIAAHWMLQGVTFQDPEHTYVDADVEIGPDTVLAAGVCLRGQTRIGQRGRIDQGVVIEDSSLGDDVWLKPHCYIEQSSIGNGCIIGPSAHFRPNVTLHDEVRIGNFVEVKNSTIGRGTKADHLSYIGDADLGERVSIGCGAITVNYDSETKSRTTIGDRAFVGCNANLIAPVRIEPDAYVAAGSTITKDVPAEALGIARGRQRNIEGWRSRRFGARGDD